LKSADFKRKGLQPPASHLLTLARSAAVGGFAAYGCGVPLAGACRLRGIFSNNAVFGKNISFICGVRAANPAGGKSGTTSAAGFFEFD
jgi:hypothetical protein